MECGQDRRRRVRGEPYLCDGDGVRRIGERGGHPQIDKHAVVDGTGERAGPRDDRHRRLGRVQPDAVDRAVKGGERIGLGAVSRDGRQVSGTVVRVRPGALRPA